MCVCLCTFVGGIRELGVTGEPSRAGDCSHPCLRCLEGLPPNSVLFKSWKLCERFCLTSSVSRAGAGTAEARLLTEERSRAARGEGKREEVVRLCASAPLLLPKAHHPLCVCAGCSRAVGTGGAGARVTASSPHELGWVEIVASRAPPVLDTLAVMKSTALKKF